MHHRSNEQGYLSLVRNVIFAGRKSDNRTGTPTRYLFGDQLRYSLRGNRLAMLTTKYISLASVAHELFWFMRGDTNQQSLATKGVNIWRDNSTREFLDSRNLKHYREYETLGPIYGFQWRHFGAKYIDCHTNYADEGYDQLTACLETIKKDPHNRRIIMSAWNPCDLDKMALPPCHVLVQFDVDTRRGELSAHLFQRSADIMLGVPYNLLSYSLLVHIMAHKCNLKAGDLICSYGNIHIYEPHVANALFQLQRAPLHQPKLKMHFDPDLDFSQLQLKHFTVQHYRHHGRLDYKMIV